MWKADCTFAALFEKSAAKKHQEFVKQIPFPLKKSHAQMRSTHILGSLHKKTKVYKSVVFLTVPAIV